MVGWQRSGVTRVSLPLVIAVLVCLGSGCGSTTKHVQSDVTPATAANGQVLTSSAALARLVQLARQSTQQVTQLHQVAVGIASPTAATSVSVERNQARSLWAQLHATASNIRNFASTPADQPAASSLASALDQYSSAAQELLSTPAKGAPPVPSTLRSQLQVTDQSWIQALAEIERAADTHLLNRLPPLALPTVSPTSSTTTTIRPA